MGRGLWFVAGAGAGVYGMLRARRVAEAFTPEGVADRVGALALGARLLADDVRVAAQAREVELREGYLAALPEPRAGAAALAVGGAARPRLAAR